MSIAAVLFDMDGVLIEAKDWHYEALNKALALFGMPISRFDHVTTFDGLPTRKKLEMLSLEHDLPRELHEFINEMKQAYTMEIVNSACKPQFVHEIALATLKQRGYKIAVCSNSVRSSVETMLNRAQLDIYVDLMVSNEDVSRGKPDPEMYVKAMTAFDLPPHRCLIVEDNENGIRAARASGGHLMVVQDVYDTNLTNIEAHIAKIDASDDMVPDAAEPDGRIA